MSTGTLARPRPAAVRTTAPCAFTRCSATSTVFVDGWPLCAEHGREHRADRGVPHPDSHPYSAPAWRYPLPVRKAALDAEVSAREWGRHVLTVTSREHRGRLQWSVACSTCTAWSGWTGLLSQALDAALDTRSRR